MDKYSEHVYSARLFRNDILILLLKVTLICATSYFGLKYMINALDPTRKQKLESKKKAEEVLEKLGFNQKSIELTEYELIIASQLVQPDSMEVTWSDVAGLEDLILEIKETVILPIQNRELFFSSKLIKPPKGVLLHGPPGCGKTLLAKATAKEAGTQFLNLQVSMLMDKWYGESQKLASAVFSLAHKLQPTIIFIDEIDSFLRSRDSPDHEATTIMKAQFMSLWDGLITDQNSTVIVMGATNRPQDVDSAILRRMPASFYVGLPNLTQRMKIILLILKSENLDENVDIQTLAENTNCFSGADLYEMCRHAALFCIRRALSVSDNNYKVSTLHPISMTDFKLALVKVQEAKQATTRS